MLHDNVIVEAKLMSNVFFIQSDANAGLDILEESIMESGIENDSSVASENSPSNRMDRNSSLTPVDGEPTTQNSMPFSVNECSSSENIDIIDATFLSHQPSIENILQGSGNGYETSLLSTIGASNNMYMQSHHGLFEDPCLAQQSSLESNITQSSSSSSPPVTTLPSADQHLEVQHFYNDDLNNYLSFSDDMFDNDISMDDIEKMAALLEQHADSIPETARLQAQSEYVRDAVPTIIPERSIRGDKPSRESSGEMSKTFYFQVQFRSNALSKWPCH